MSLHPSIVRLIQASGLRNGWGAVARPEYYAGCGVRALWHRPNTAPEKLHLLWQEITLLEELGELPLGSAENFADLIDGFEILYPDDFMQTLLDWGKCGYGRMKRQHYRPYESSNEIVGMCMVIGLSQRNPEMDAAWTSNVKMAFNSLVCGGTYFKVFCL